MSPSQSDEPDRRNFLGQLVVGAAALATASCGKAQPVAQAPAPARPQSAGATTAAVATATHSTPPAKQSWDLSWTERLTGEHRQVFDSPQIGDGTVFHHARMFYTNFGEVYDLKDADLRAVIVIRHHGIPMALGDTIWAKYDFIGKDEKLKDPTTGKWTQRNPFMNAKPGDKYSMVWPDGTLDALIGRGAIVLACNMALMHFSSTIATRTNQPVEAVQSECKAALVPGVTLVPSGIFGVIRAEEGGCHYLRATSMG